MMDFANQAMNPARGKQTIVAWASCPCTADSPRASNFIPPKYTEHDFQRRNAAAMSPVNGSHDMHFQSAALAHGDLFDWRSPLACIIRSVLAWAGRPCH